MAEAGGILQWAVDGCTAYQRDGLDPPAAVRKATADYFAAENIFDQWIDHCCELGADVWDNPTMLFDSWKRYAESANEKVGTKKSFGERLGNAGFESGNSRARGGRYWEGLRLTRVRPD